MTSENSPEQDLLPMELPSMSSVAGSRAKTSQSLEKGLASKVLALVSGRSTGGLLASYDPVSSSWRTSQACLVSGWQPFSETFPRSGLMLSGTVFQLVPSAPLTDATEFGLLPTPVAKEGGYNQGGGSGRVGPIRPTLSMMARRAMWPTPRANDAEKRGDFANDPRNGLPAAAKYWPTPTTRDWRSGCASQETMERNARPLSEVVGGQLNPTWVEWLQGFPLGWTEVD
jgi:hypothetical protein